MFMHDSLLHSDLNPGFAGFSFPLRNGLVAPEHYRSSAETRFFKCGPHRTNPFLSILSCVALVLSGFGSTAAFGAKSGVLTSSTNSVSLGSVAVGSATSKTLTLSNNGSVAIRISSLSVTGSSFTAAGQSSLPATVAAGSTFKVTLQFAPVKAGSIAGSVTVSSKSSTTLNNNLKISLTGMGIPVLSAFSCTNSTITGAGTNSCTATLNAAATSGGVSVSLASNNTAVTVPSTVTVASGVTAATFTAAVSPVQTTQAATIAATTGIITKTFALQLNSATGTATLSINAISVAFGNVEVNTTSTQSLTMSSTGDAAVTVDSAIVTGTGYSISGVTFPLTLSAGQSATLATQFSPATTGAATGQITISSNSSGGSNSTVSLSGTAVAPVVDLSWNAPSSSPDPVAGYNVYRAACGSSTYAQLNASVIAATNYIDGTVQSGQSYDYFVESVDSAGNESAPSDIAAAAIP